MIKHFCDICGKHITDNDTAIKEYQLFESFESSHGLQYTKTSGKELCYACAKALSSLPVALSEHKTIIIK